MGVAVLVEVLVCVWLVLVKVIVNLRTTAPRRRAFANQTDT